MLEMSAVHVERLPQLVLATAAHIAFVSERLTWWLEQRTLTPSTKWTRKA